MTTLPPLPLSGGHSAACLAEADTLTLLLNGHSAARFTAHRGERKLTLALEGGVDAALPPAALYALLAEAFRSDRDTRRVTLELGAVPEFAAAAHRLGLVQTLEAGRAVAWRSAFWQLPGPWLAAPASGLFPPRLTVTNHHQHPLRPPKPHGDVYRRFLPEIGETLSFRTVDPERDLDVFHQWMNQQRVDHFWEMAGTRESHAEYLQKLLADPHSHPLIGCFDDVPFGYFETYWAKEDRISPFYDADDYDRGCHVLVGDSRFRGPRRFPLWLRAIAHYLFIDEPRCRRFVGEPRVDNNRFIEHLQDHGFVKRKEFDFPHKRAALVVMERDVFFDQFGL
ncbi:GNAT family N-acetyltransferase [Crenobacter sp. SG2305]|uniref:GNAT family N-acetyltransferase n=1 Tax=Crenobacter oryzisoli TaxID=3056844 RepID=UPI0025AA7BDB|nr:GNAT family N-acetyltransferase [Crenobacter sp. SG2305]MDN0083590.1 GNAT family N-acetyltransferase [Crenobacter sp. SG2305]